MPRVGRRLRRPFCGEGKTGLAAAEVAGERQDFRGDKHLGVRRLGDKGEEGTSGDWAWETGPEMDPVRWAPGDRPQKDLGG